MCVFLYYCIFTYRCLKKRYKNVNKSSILFVWGLFMVENVNFNGLLYCARKFEEDGRFANGKHWKIANGGYDLLFEVYYDNFPVAGYIRDDGFSNYGHLNETEMNKLMHTICLEVSGLKETLTEEERRAKEQKEDIELEER